MYYCLNCNEYHAKSTAKMLLKTGFRTESDTKEKFPLGFCDKNKPPKKADS
ncbi:DUF3973 domain-containing protein [Ammoniphilus sp. 3BR4]|uniref:DUF3973 domain-containing protein n=1 Tax=Ammoniphilus sp. 3BR4 TaxID=3158265 RepID=UPI003466778E